MTLVACANGQLLLKEKYHHVVNYNRKYKDDKFHGKQPRSKAGTNGAVICINLENTRKCEHIEIKL